MASYLPMFPGESLSLSLSLSNTHTHTHTHTGKLTGKRYSFSPQEGNWVESHTGKWTVFFPDEILQSQSWQGIAQLFKTVTGRKNLEDVLLSGRNQTQKDKYCMMPLSEELWNSWIHRDRAGVARAAGRGEWGARGRVAFARWESSGDGWCWWLTQQSECAWYHRIVHLKMDYTKKKKKVYTVNFMLNFELLMLRYSMMTSSLIRGQIREQDWYLLGAWTWQVGLLNRMVGGGREVSPSLSGKYSWSSLLISHMYSNGIFLFFTFWPYCKSCGI